MDQYILSFKRFNIEISFNNNTLHKIASIAHRENIGARALSSTLEKIFREFKFELPSTKVRFIFVTEELIENPDKKLKKYLNSPAKQMSIDIQNKINDECEKRRLSKFDSTELLSLCKTSANKGTIIETINDYLSKNQPMSHIIDNIIKIKNNIPSNVTLVAATKYATLDDIKTLSTHMPNLILGENRVQQGEEKQKKFPPSVTHGTLLGTYNEIKLIKLLTTMI